MNSLLLLLSIIFVSFNFTNAWLYGYGFGVLNQGLYGYPYYSYLGKRQIDVIQRVGCMINPSETKSILNCNNGAVQCEVVPNLEGLSIGFDMFGIEYFNSNTLKLHPRLFTDVGFNSNRVAFTNGFINELVLAPVNFNSKGIMVKDSVCFSKILNLFRNIKVDGKGSMAGFIL